MKKGKSVGLDNKHSQIHFIPGNKPDYAAKEEQLERFEANA
jgi:hypothetical protein